MHKIFYLDFDLLIEKMGEIYKARVVNSPAGQATSQFTFPLSDKELKKFFLNVGRYRNAVRRFEKRGTDTTKEIGERLFNVVFRDEVRICLQRSIDEADRQGSGLRIKLRLSEAPELLDLPWEYLYNPTFDLFISLSRETSLVRYIDLPDLIPKLSINPPLKILVMISNPHNFQKLNVEHEWSKLKEALADLESQRMVELERLDNPMLTNLQRQLRRKEYHIFHYIGHGGFDTQDEDGVLIFEDKARNGFPVRGQYLGTLLHDHRSLRIVFLNACEGGRTSISDPFAGVAQSLIRQGIPAVIAMQFAITDRAAISLSYEFYNAIVDGYPVDASLTEARKSIFTQGNPIEWGTPVLYMRSPDGYIFDIEKPIKKEKPQQIKKPKYLKERKTKLSHSINRLFLFGRLILILLMIAIPIYLSKIKSELKAEINIISSHLKLILNYSNPIGKEIELLGKQSIKTRFLITKGFKPFEINTKSSYGERAKTYRIDPENNDKIDLEFNTGDNFFHINSLKFKGSTQLELSIGDIANSVHFRSVEDSSDLWNVYADIILPGTFKITSNALKIYQDSQPVVNNELQINSPTDKGFQKIVLKNNRKILDLDFDKVTRLSLKELDIINFQTKRYDYFKDKDVSALITGKYNIFGLNKTIGDTILTHDDISFKAEQLILRGLKIEDKAIAAKIDGKFSSFQIGQMDDYDEKMPSMLLKIINSRFGYFYSFIYLLIFILTLLWQRIFNKSFMNSSLNKEKSNRSK
ncbi:MAG: CHAT domain-containing protein [Candidatus Hodarchaeota archaeon]